MKNYILKTLVVSSITLATAQASYVPMQPISEEEHDHMCKNLLIASNGGDMAEEFQSEEQGRKEMHAYMCAERKEYKEENFHETREYRFGLKLGLFRGNANYSREEFNHKIETYRNENCSNEEKKQVRAENSHVELKNKDPEVLAAYTRCISTYKPQPATCLIDVDRDSGMGKIEIINHQDYLAGNLVYLTLSGNHNVLLFDSELENHQMYPKYTRSGYLYYHSDIDDAVLNGYSDSQRDGTIPSSAIFSFQIKDLQKPGFLIFSAKTINGAWNNSNVDVTCYYDYSPNEYRMVMDKNIANSKNNYLEELQDSAVLSKQ